MHTNFRPGMDALAFHRYRYLNVYIHKVPKTTHKHPYLWFDDKQVAFYCDLLSVAPNWMDCGLIKYVFPVYACQYVGMSVQHASYQCESNWLTFFNFTDSASGREQRCCWWRFGFLRNRVKWWVWYAHSIIDSLQCQIY